jgi:hypothetical protein
MSATGLSKARLERMHHVLSGHVQRGEMARLVALVSRHDDVHVETLGTLSVDRAAPMRRDTIFRIASLAKPIAGAHRSSRAEVHGLADRRHGAGGPRDHRARSPDVPHGGDGRERDESGDDVPAHETIQ